MTTGRINQVNGLLGNDTRLSPPLPVLLPLPSPLLPPFSRPFPFPFPLPEAPILSSFVAPFVLTLSAGASFETPLFGVLPRNPPFSIPEAPEGALGDEKERSTGRTPERGFSKGDDREREGKRGRKGGRRGSEGVGEREGKGQGGRGGKRGAGGGKGTGMARAGSRLFGLRLPNMGHRFVVPPFCFSLPSPPGWRGLTRPRREGRVARRAIRRCSL